MNERLRAALPLLVLGCGCYAGAALGWTFGAAAGSAAMLWLFSMYPLLILVGAGLLAAGWIRWNSPTLSSDEKDELWSQKKTEK